MDEGENLVDENIILFIPFWVFEDATVYLPTKKQKVITDQYSTVQ